MLFSLLTAVLLASSAQAGAEAPAAPETAVETPETAAPVAEEPAASQPAADVPPAEEAVEEEPEEPMVCRRRSVQDDFGRQKSIKVCRPKSHWRK